jgi:transketolase
MNLSVIYVFTHDSVAVGEDGPTHQPIEQLASLRIIPNLTVLRPADATETAEAWRQAIQTTGPVALILSRQKLPILNHHRFAQAENVKNGAYILTDTDGIPDLILIASGSEVHLALSAQQRLADQSIKCRVVSMPSWELFEKMPDSYKHKVLPPEVTRRIAIEAGHPAGWEKYVGCSGSVIGIQDFGTSAPGAEVMDKFNLTAENVYQNALKLISV